MQNELRWALLAIGVALIILVVVGVKIKKNRQAGLKEFEDASWHPENDILVDETSNTDEIFNDAPQLEKVGASHPKLDTELDVVPVLNVASEQNNDIPVVSSDVGLVPSIEGEPKLDSPMAKDSSKPDNVPNLNASSATNKTTPSLVPKFLTKERDDDFSEQIAPPYHVEKPLSDLVDDAHQSHNSPSAIADVTADDLDVAAALTSASEIQIDEVKKGEQTRLLFDDEFENQVKKHLEKREAEKKHAQPEPATPATKNTQTPEPRYSTVEAYDVAKSMGKLKPKESDDFKPRYSTVKNLKQDEIPEPTKKPAQEPVVEPPQSVAAAVSKNKDPEVIILHIKATDSIGFYGPQIAKTLGDIGMKFGDMGIYHYQSSGQRILSVSNIVKPGYFEPKKFSQFTTPGLSMFASVYPDSDMDFVKEVIEKSAQYIRAQLKGVLYDMNHQRIENLASYVGTQMDDIQTIFNEA